MPTENHTVVLVTGANRGIGAAIIEILATDPTYPTPLTIYACSRAAIDLKLSVRANVTIKYIKLDITSPTSVATLPHEIDILINVAGLNIVDDDGSWDSSQNYSTKQKIIDVNFWGTLRMCELFMSKNQARKRNGKPRIVNVSSAASGLGQYPEGLQRRLRDHDEEMGMEGLRGLVREYEDLAKKDQDGKVGWTPGAYWASKAFINAMTAIIARENPSVVVNCCCPGWVDTAMGAMVVPEGAEGALTTAEGARIPLRLAFADLEGVSGRYWANDSMTEKGEGKVQSW